MMQLFCIKNDKCKLLAVALSLALLLLVSIPAMGQSVPSSSRCISGCNTPTNNTPPPAPDLTRSFVLDQVASQGEFYVLTRDGHKLNGQNAAQVPIDNGAKAITGPSGSVLITFSDGSTMALGPNSEFAIDDFFYDPNTGVKHFSAVITKGVFRWVTGHVEKKFDPMVRVPVGTLGIRGTDFECAASPDGSGYIKLFSGELDFTPYDSDRVINLTAGQMITYTDFVNISGPMPIQ
jgi:hypothetical protein